jgi:enterochelin esterase-like enzyme
VSRRLRRRAAIGLGSLTLIVAGAVGAYGYAKDYSLHRGFATVPQLPRAGTGRLLQVSFYSPALHRRADYMVYLPPGYRTTQRYPVYYLLHGMPGQPHVFVTIANMDVRLDNQLSLGHLKPMILVYPDGRIGGDVYSDSEWANTPSGKFESYVIDVMHNVDANFSTLADRRDRVIAGFSAGAYGALNIALHNLFAFGAAQVWSGYFTQARTGVFAQADATTLSENSPLDYVASLRHTIARYPLRLYMFVGRADESAGQLLPMVRAARGAGATVAYASYPGGHDWSVWYPRLNQMLILASGDMGQTAAPTGAAVTHRHAAATLTAPHAGGITAEHPGQITTAHPGLTATVRIDRHSYVRLIAALLLALLSAAAINLGFLLQHRGLHRATPVRVRGLLTNRSWLGGQALGWTGFLAQIVAVGLAPLSIVQAFAAGGLAVSVPIAARALGHRLAAPQLLAVLAIAVCLFTLPVGFTTAHAHLSDGTLVVASLIALIAATALAWRRRAAAQAIAAGVFYGLADAAIKADSIGVRNHGAAALVSGWTVLAGLGTFAGFLAFQSALRDRHAVNAIALMNAFAALAALALGLSAFGESLGTSTLATAVHLGAIGLVLVCVVPLAYTHQRWAGGAGPESGHRPRGDDGEAAVSGSVAPTATRRIAMAIASAAAVVVVLAMPLVATGLLYSLRQARWFNFGPRIPDALPLLQLAGFDGQPLARVLVAWLPAGMVVGFQLHALRPTARTIVVAAVTATLLVLASDASYALARNLRFGDVLRTRAPGLGPWLEATILAAASALPAIWRRRPGLSRTASRWLQAGLPRGAPTRG